MEETELLAQKSLMELILQGITKAFIPGIVGDVKRKYHASEVTPENTKNINLLRKLNTLDLSGSYDERSAIRDILEGNVHKVFDINSVIGISRNGHTIFAENRDKRALEDMFRAEDMAQRRYGFKGLDFLYRTQTGTISDLFDDFSLRCCAFHPNGRSKYSAALYTVDPNTALIHLVKMENGYEAEIIGVAICFFADWMGKRYLVIDSVEGKKLTRRRKHDFQKAINIFAQRNGCEGILYNTKVHNATPKGFNIFLSRVRGLRQVEGNIAKHGGDSYIQRYGVAASLYFESFPRIPIPGKWDPQIYKRQMYGVVTGLYQPIG